MTNEPPPGAIFNPIGRSPSPVKHIGLAVPLPLHEKIKAVAKQHDVSIDALCIQAIAFALRHMRRVEQ
jgi:hypothetical protein